MRLSTIRLVCALFVAPLLVAACENPQQRRDPVPPGVSLDPPRQAPATGSLAVPGQQPDVPLPAGAEEPVLTDTVSVPTERMDAPAPAPAQPAPAGTTPAGTTPAGTPPAQAPPGR